MDFKLKKPGEIRVRFAPAPTGPLHIGGARTALFNFLFARKNQGYLIIRIEDTDIERSSHKWEKDILESLKWLGIEYDEGPDREGDCGPYRQSERLEIYAPYLEKLISEGRAYHCFCSEEELKAQREYFLSIGKLSIYNGKCQGLSRAEVEKKIQAGEKSILRFRTPAKKIVLKDWVRGEVEFDTTLIGDFSIARGIKSPLYNFAVVVDDFEMRVSHVLRAEEHLSNTPKQILIAEALEFPLPEFAHLPMILGPDRSKLSKRHGATGVSDFKKQGYFPEALVNFMAFLGWNPGSEREIYSISSLIRDFSLERVKKAGAIFNIKKLDNLNGFYIRGKPLDKLTEECVPYLIEAGLIKPVFGEEERVPELPSVYFGKEVVVKYELPESRGEVNFAYLKKVVALYQERLRKLSEIARLTDYFFKSKLDYPKDLLVWKDLSENEIKVSLDRSEQILSKIGMTDWNEEKISQVVLAEAEEWGRALRGKPDRGYLVWPLRVALTGKEASAGPFEIVAVLGREKTLSRIREARDLIIRCRN